MKIEVTQEDIDLGHRRAAARCPVARALTRATGRDWSVGLTSNDRYTLHGDTAHFLAPKVVNKFALAFDRSESVEPFSFELDNTLEPYRFGRDS